MNVNYERLFEILEELGAEPKNKGKFWVCKTICHMGDSHKLYFYLDSNTFHCFTECNRITLYDFLKEQGINYNEVVETNHEIKIIDGFNTQEVEIPVYDYSPKKEIELLPEKQHDFSKYYNYYYKGWIDENISIQSMIDFNIKYDLLNDRIIMPHYDYKNHLIGVRCRELSDEMQYKKYHPLYNYEFETSKNLYGIHKIENTEPLIIVEAEKSVLQLRSYGYKNAVAIMGSFLSDEQVDIINNLSEINEIVIALDKEYDIINTDKFILQQKKIRNNFYDKLKRFGRTISCIVDRDNLLEEKDSPSDKGKEVFNRLYENRVILKEDVNE